MAGTKGMKRPSAANVIRRQIWRSIRILRRFTRPDLMRTVPGATTSNVWKYLSQLVRHGYLIKIGYSKGNLGEFQIYGLAADRAHGPEHPNVCSRCGASLAATECITQEEKEKEKEKEKERETKTGGSP